ncbi:alpha-2-macroglobulin family protein [Candidatus Omnitrophus magneticus]|uniref:Alpha-2-macroglobulin family protein n=1 Tax=Candidatus Omnitrophus magneticus TaxID=1609969 RepID=A0A0F0CRA6_9BACT|nr:alpha-2-macroglobulin family protein [Candidatus Omnitrophus magneticus]
MIRGATSRQRLGKWDTTVANAWGIVALSRFREKFESTPVSGVSMVKLQDSTQTISWNDTPKGKELKFIWPGDKQTAYIVKKGDGDPWMTIRSMAAIPIKEPLSSGYKIKKTITAVEQKRPGIFSIGDVVRVRIDGEAQTDMTWVVIDDPIPAGVAVLGSGLGRDSSILTQSETDNVYAWPIYEERTFEAFRAYYEFVPKGLWNIEYTMRLNNEGIFKLPQTRIEAMYSPEMFGEIPNDSFKITK